MSGGDGTGPVWRNAGSGCGLGGMRGKRRGHCACIKDEAGVSKEALQRQKEILERRLDAVNKKLENQHKEPEQSDQ